MKNIDKLTWKFSRIEPIEVDKIMNLGQEFNININGSVIRELISDNQDGTVNICYVVAPSIIELNENADNDNNPNNSGVSKR